MRVGTSNSDWSQVSIIRSYRSLLRGMHHDLRVPLRPRCKHTAERRRVPDLRRQRTRTQRRVSSTHRMKPDKKSGGGVTARPAASRGLRMSNVAVMHAIASQTLVSPRNLPGHILDRCREGPSAWAWTVAGGDAPAAVPEDVPARVEAVGGRGVEVEEPLGLELVGVFVQALVARHRPRDRSVLSESLGLRRGWAHTRCWGSPPRLGACRTRCMCPPPSAGVRCLAALACPICACGSYVSGEGSWRRTVDWPVHFLEYALEIGQRVAVVERWDSSVPDDEVNL